MKGSTMLQLFLTISHMNLVKFWSYIRLALAVKTITWNVVSRSIQLWNKGLKKYFCKLVQQLECLSTQNSLNLSLFEHGENVILSYIKIN